MSFKTWLLTLLCAAALVTVSFTVNLNRRVTQIEHRLGMPREAWEAVNVPTTEQSK